MTRMSARPAAKKRHFAAHVHNLGCTPHADCEALVHRLSYDALSRGDGRIVLLLAEHPPLVTIGRGGLRGDIKLAGSELAVRGLAVRYVARGGGAVLHGPGQLAIYPIVPLAWHRWSVGEFLRRLQGALRETLASLQIEPREMPSSLHLWGEHGPVALVGASVRRGVTGYGAILSLDADQEASRLVLAAGGRPLSSVLSERPGPVRMERVQDLLVNHLARAFGCEDHSLHSGHPLLVCPTIGGPAPLLHPRESAA
jgi:lipoyl(octanoyl) transferase